MNKIKNTIKGILATALIVGAPYGLYKTMKSVHEYRARGSEEVANFRDGDLVEIVVTDGYGNISVLYKQNNGTYEDLLGEKAIAIEDRNGDGLEDLYMKEKGWLFDTKKILYGQKDGTFKNRSKIENELENKLEESKNDLEKKMEDEQKKMEDELNLYPN